MMMITATTPNHAMQPWQTASPQSQVKLSTSTAEAFGLFGKEAEFTQLLKHVEQGQSKLCLLLGDAGMGKSTLLNALQQAVSQQNNPASLPAKCQLIMLDFLAYDASHLAGNSFYTLLLNALTLWLEKLEAQCINLLNSKTPEGFTLQWDTESLASLITKANEQPSIAQRRAFLEVHIQTTLRAQQNWIDKLFTPVKETIQVLVQTLDSPWINLLVECQQILLPNLVQWAKKRTTSEQAKQLFEKKLVASLVQITDFFKQQLSSAALGETTLTLIIDNWDVLLTQLPAEKRWQYQTELTALASAFQEYKQQPFHLIVGVRTDELGKSLGPILYNLLRIKLLLPALTEAKTEAFILNQALLPSFLHTPIVYDWLNKKAQGNPYWIGLLCAALQRKTQAVTTENTEITDATVTGWLAGLAMEQATDCHAFLLTQLQLGVVQYGVGYGEALQHTVSALTYQPFEVPALMEKITTLAPQLSINDVALVLRKLFLFGCLRQLRVTTLPTTENPVPQYQVVHRLLLGYLKARLTQTRLSQQFNLMEQQESNWFEAKQQLQTLKTILPLTLEQGELTIGKVQGLLNLTQQFQPEFNQEFQTFFITLLEETIASQTKPVVLKRDALAGLAYLNQDKFLPLFLNALLSEEALLQETALTALVAQGSLQGGHFASPQRPEVLQQLVATATQQLEGAQTTLQPNLLKAIEAWAFPLRQETKALLLTFLQACLGQIAADPTALSDNLVVLANRLLADPQLTEEEKNALLPEVMALLQGILQNETTSGKEALRLVKQYRVENTPEPLFQLLEKLSADVPTNTQPFAIKQEALAMLLVRFTYRENALQAWLETLEADLDKAVQQANQEGDEEPTDSFLNKRIALASLQTAWPEWAKQQLQQAMKAQLHSRAWEEWLGQPDLLWVLLKCLLTVSPNEETRGLAKQWLDRLQAPVFEEYEGLQLLGACLRGQLSRAI